MTNKCENHKWSAWGTVRGWESWHGSYKRTCLDCGQAEYEEANTNE